MMASFGGRSVCLRVNLDNLTSNIDVLRSRYPSSKTGVIGVVKAGGYGHGSVGVSRHLKNIGVERLAVATIQEGVHLRKHGIKGPIHVFGNVQGWEMGNCLLYALIPTVCDLEAIEAMSQKMCDMNTGQLIHTPNRERSTKQTDHGDTGHSDQSKYQCDDIPYGSVNIKIDSGMSRNGCQPEDLLTLVQKCQDVDVPIDAMFTHFADSWGNQEFTQKQLDIFLQATEPFMSMKIKRHVANSAAILRGYGTDLDFIRPGISMYGLPPDSASPEFQQFGLRPIGSLVGYPTMVKKLSEGRKVGYSMTHTTTRDEWVATFPVGYADGYWRHLSSRGIVIRDKTGERCPVIGRVSMDAITVKVPPDTSLTDSFTIMSADYDPVTSACGIAATVGTISYEVGTSLSTRLPRVYVWDNDKVMSVEALGPENY